MVRETSDGGRWTLPGGWADVNITAAENAAKEVLEESGYIVRVEKLAALWDRTRQGHSAGVFSCCKLFFLCALTGGEAATGHETSAVGWFSEADLPEDLPWAACCRANCSGCSRTGAIGRCQPNSTERSFGLGGPP